jgi:two-component system, NarL family, response regulator LiaR
MTETNPIRILIVDDHDMVRSGLGIFLQAFDDLKLVGEASNGIEAVRLCRELKPDIVLMDLIMPEMDGVTAIRSIHQDLPGVGLIALTSFTDQHLVTEALKAGAIGYILKNIPIDELAAAIRNAKAGKPVIAAEVFKSVFSTMPAESSQGHKLTSREREILSLMIGGLNNIEIAKKLVISRATVKTHICNIFSKLGVSNRVEAVALAVQKHLLE